MQPHLLGPNSDPFPALQPLQIQSHAQVTALPDPPSHLEKVHILEVLAQKPPVPEGYFAFPGEVIPPLPTLFLPGLAKPCGWGTWGSKEFWGPVSLPQILALLGRPISR